MLSIHLLLSHWQICESFSESVVNPCAAQLLLPSVCCGAALVCSDFCYPFWCQEHQRPAGSQAHFSWENSPSIMVTWMLSFSIFSSRQPGRCKPFLQPLAILHWQCLLLTGPIKAVSECHLTEESTNHYLASRSPWQLKAAASFVLQSRHRQDSYRPHPCDLPFGEGLWSSFMKWTRKWQFLGNIVICQELQMFGKSHKWQNFLTITGVHWRCCVEKLSWTHCSSSDHGGVSRFSYRVCESLCAPHVPYVCILVQNLQGERWEPLHIRVSGEGFWHCTLGRQWHLLPGGVSFKHDECVSSLSLLVLGGFCSACWLF